jgi:hypothetical protein
MEVPEHIDGYTVLEYGFFPEPILPKGYLPPSDGRAPLEPVQNLAICTAAGVEGFYLLCSTPDWRRVAFCFNETIEYAKRSLRTEFGRDVVVWCKRG